MGQSDKKAIVIADSLLSTAISKVFLQTQNWTTIYCERGGSQKSLQVLRSYRGTHTVQISGNEPP